MQPHREVGGVLFRLRLGPRSHIPDDEVKWLRSSTFRRMSLSQVRHRVYALTEASKYVLIVFGTLVTSSLVTGLWFMSMPSAKGIIWRV